MYDFITLSQVTCYLLGLRERERERGEREGGERERGKEGERGEKERGERVRDRKRDL